MILMRSALFCVDEACFVDKKPLDLSTTRENTRFLPHNPKPKNKMNKILFTTERVLAIKSDVVLFYPL